MKKSAMVLSLVLPALIAGAGQADAKHRGFLETNNQVSDEAPAAMATNPSEAYKTRAQDNYNNAIDNVKDYAGDKAEQAGDYISDKASDARDYAKEKYNNAKKYVKEKTGDAEDHIKDKKAEHKDRHDKKMKTRATGWKTKDTTLTKIIRKPCTKSKIATAGQPERTAARPGRRKPQPGARTGGRPCRTDEKAQSRARRIPRRIYERQIQPQSGQGSHEHLVTQNAGYKTPRCVGII